MNYTKSEWLAVGAWVEVKEDDVADICNCDTSSMNQGHISRSYDEMCANARLIAAAPDMYESLSKLVQLASDLMTMCQQQKGMMFQDMAKDIGKPLLAAKRALKKVSNNEAANE